MLTVGRVNKDMYSSTDLLLDFKHEKQALYLRIIIDIYNLIHNC